MIMKKLKELMQERNLLEKRIERLKVKIFEELLDKYSRGEIKGIDVVFGMRWVNRYGGTPMMNDFIKKMAVIMHKKGIHVPEIMDRLRKLFYPPLEVIFDAYPHDLSLIHI